MPTPWVNLKRLVSLVVIVFVFACGKQPAGPPQGNAVSFSREIEPLLNNRCAFTGCHGAINPNPIGAPMILETGASYAALLGDAPFTGRPSFQMPQLLRVNPGKPDSSYLILKLKGLGLGSRMPFFGDPLPPETIARSEQWVREGAQRN